MLAPHIPSAFLSTKSSSQLVFVHPGLKRGPGGCPVLVLSPPSPLLYKVRLVRLPHSYWTGASAWPLGWWPLRGPWDGARTWPVRSMSSRLPGRSLQTPPWGGPPSQIVQKERASLICRFLSNSFPPRTAFLLFKEPQPEKTECRLWWVCAGNMLP